MRAIVVNLKFEGRKVGSVVFDRHGLNSSLYNEYKTDEQYRNQAISNAIGSAMQQGIEIDDFNVHIVN
jgi:hypothetical protein